MHGHTHCMNTLVMYKQRLERWPMSVCLSVCLALRGAVLNWCKTIYESVLYSVRQDLQCVCRTVKVNTADTKATVLWSEYVCACGCV